MPVRELGERMWRKMRFSVFQGVRSGVYSARSSFEFLVASRPRVEIPLPTEDPGPVHTMEGTWEIQHTSAFFGDTIPYTEPGQQRVAYVPVSSGGSVFKSPCNFIYIGSFNSWIPQVSGRLTRGRYYPSLHKDDIST